MTLTAPLLLCWSTLLPSFITVNSTLEQRWCQPGTFDDVSVSLTEWLPASRCRHHKIMHTDGKISNANLSWQKLDSSFKKKKSMQFMPTNMACCACSNIGCENPTKPKDWLISKDIFNEWLFNNSISMRNLVSSLKDDCLKRGQKKCWLLLVDRFFEATVRAFHNRQLKKVKKPPDGECPN